METTSVDELEELWHLENATPWDPADPDLPDPNERAWVRSPLAEMAHLQRAQAMFTGGMLEEIDTFVRAEVADARIESAHWPSGRRFDYLQTVRQSAAAQIGLTLGLAPKAAEALVARAEAFTRHCPATLAALCAGRISPAKAEVILDQTANLSAALTPAVEAQALAAAEGRTVDRFRDKVRRLVEKADADAVRRRQEKARAERRVELWPDRDGMWALHAVLPAEEAYAAYGILDAYAHAAKKAQEPGDDRGIDALRADALMDLLRDPGGADRIVYQVRVVVPVGTVLGVGEEPGHIPGHGPIPAEVCRRIAGDATWKRLLTDPDTGALLDAGADTYKPSVRLLDFVRTRDQTCRWPGCRRKAHRSDLDHTISFHQHGGRTIRINLAALCRRHHRIKHLPGWTCTQDPDGTLTFTTPHGEIYRTRPPTLTGEDHPVQSIESEGAQDEAFPF